MSCNNLPASRRRVPSRGQEAGWLFSIIKSLMVDKFIICSPLKFFTLRLSKLKNTNNSKQEPKKNAEVSTITTAQTTACHEQIYT